MNALAALVLLGLSLGGCASSPMDARAELPAPPKTGAYPSLQDQPPDREKTEMTVDERSKLKKELTTARDRQTSATKVRGSATQTAPKKSEADQ